MKFQANSKDLLAAVTAASSVIKRAFIPVMECVLIRADDRLLITGTNLDAQITAECRASITGQGDIAVNADDLKRYLSGIGDTTVTVEGDTRLTATCARAKVDLIAFPAVEFPAAMQADAPHEVAGARDAFQLCASYASTDPARQNIGGVRVSPDGTVATDGGKLAFHPATCEAGATIPSAATRTIGDILKAGGRLFVGETIWRAEAEGIIAKGKLLDWGYPDWQRIIPRDPVPLFEADADDLLAAINCATLGQAGTVFLRSSEGSVILRGETWAAARADATAECTADVAETFAGAFKTPNLVGALKPLSGSVIRFGFGGNVILAEPVGGDGRKVCISPWTHADQAWPSAQRAAA